MYMRGLRVVNTGLDDMTVGILQLNLEGNFKRKHTYALDRKTVELASVYTCGTINFNEYLVHINIPAVHVLLS